MQSKGDWVDKNPGFAAFIMWAVSSLMFFILVKLMERSYVNLFALLNSTTVCIGAMGLYVMFVCSGYLKLFLRSKAASKIALIGWFCLCFVIASVVGFLIILFSFNIMVSAMSSFVCSVVAGAIATGVVFANRRAAQKSDNNAVASVAANNIYAPPGVGGNRYCGKCGAAIKEGNAFCTSCGAAADN